MSDRAREHVRRAFGVAGVRGRGRAGQGASVAEVRRQAERFLARDDVLVTVQGFTTVELVECERRLIDAAVGRADEGVGVLDADVVERVIDTAEWPLTVEQAAVVRAVAASGRGVEVVGALAGTGKTYTAGVIRELYEDAGYEVIGVAPTGRAARELADEAGIPSRTLDRLLIDLDQLGDTLPQPCVIVFDEAGMAATRTTARLLEAAGRAGTKVVAIGDPGQLASVQAGGWLQAVGRDVGALRLTEVMRQRDPGERRALAGLHDRVPNRYLDWAAQTGRIDTFENPASAREAAVAEWARAAGEVGVEWAVMIARDNDTRRALNQAARDLRRAQGLLGEQRSYGHRELAVGDRVICRRNDAPLDVDNGTRGTVRHLDEDRVVIETDSHLIRELPANYVAEHVEHAYALTGHGMQGATVEAAIVVASPRDLTAGWIYTALSRARDRTRLLIHDDQRVHDRADVAPEQDRQVAGRDGLLARASRRMLERDDEDLAIEHLPPADRADDRQLTLAHEHAGGPAQEHAAARAEPAVPDASVARLRALRERIDTFDRQRDALPRSELHEFHRGHARAIALTQQRAELTTAIERLSSPTRSLLGRVRDPDLVERVRLTSALGGIDQAIERTREAETALRERLGDPEQMRAELDGLDRMLTQLEQERSDPRRGHRPRTPGPQRMGTRAARRPAGRLTRPRVGRRAAPCRALPPRPRHHRHHGTARPSTCRRAPSQAVAARARNRRARRARPPPRAHP